MDRDFTPGTFVWALVETVSFIGEKNVALISGALVALLLMIVWKKGGKQAMFNSVQAALMSGGIIILITAAGGAFGGMLQQTGISARIVDLTQGYQRSEEHTSELQSRPHLVCRLLL